MNKHTAKIICVILCAILTVTFITVLHYLAPEIPAVPETTGDIVYQDAPSELSADESRAIIGEDLTAIRISDLHDLNQITKVNYVANKFVTANALNESANVQIVDLKKPFKFAKKGTLSFVVMNLDPESNDFKEQSQRLSDYKTGDYWHFTMSLPKIFCASNIYVNSDLVARHGTIANYNFIDYSSTSYNKTTKNFTERVERTSLDLKFYTRQQALNPYQIVTIHYQSYGTMYSGIADCPLIGTESAVTGILEFSQNLLIAFSVLALAVCAILIVLSLLKHTKDFVGPIVWIFGIALMLLPKFILNQATPIPLIWSALTWTGAFFSLGGGMITLGRDFGKYPVKAFLLTLMFLGGALAITCPFVPYDAASILHSVYKGIKAFGALALFAFAAFATFDPNDRHSIPDTATAAVISITIIASLFLPTVFPVHLNSMFWLCVITMITTFASVFKMIRDTEKANNDLTSNLHMEVERQIQDIKSVIAERDDLLRFVSHDMKKPLLASTTLIDTLIERESDTEQIKGMMIIRQNTSRVIENLSDIGSYTRFNYIAEPSQITDLHDLCVTVCEFHSPDCNANGIVLHNLVERRFKVFVKKQGLENAISNIILNAIEHADCSTITLSAKSEKGKIVLSIADNGKGINEDVDAFRAYVPGKPESSGVGLYICRNMIEAMNGQLTYESSSSGTVFYISLLKA